MNTASIISFALLLLLVPIVGILLAITPWLMRRNECFAVTVPAGQVQNPRLVALKLKYTKTMFAVTAIVTVLTGIAYWNLLDPAAGTAGSAGASASSASNYTLSGNELALTFVILIATLAPLAISFGLMLSNRKRVQAIKAEEGWVAQTQTTAVFLAEGDSDEAPRAISLAWNLLYVPILVSSVVLTYVLYPIMPDAIPMQMGFDGQINSYMPKGPGVYAFPVLFTLFVGATMAFSHWTITRSKRPTDPGAPATSAFAYGMFARAMSITLVASGLLLTAATSYCFILSAANVVSMTTMLVVVVGVAMIIVLASIGVSVVYGQAGSRLYSRMRAEGDTALAFDDDEHWILGIIYFNKDDASLFLPERFGIGWTMNMARPAAWAIIGGLALLIIGFVVALMAVTV